jgi:hypothetical protein
LDPRFTGSNLAEVESLNAIKNTQLDILQRGSKAVGPM